MSGDLSGAEPFLLVVAIGVPIVVFGVLALGRIESWWQVRRAARRHDTRRPRRARDIDRRV